ncbi:MAG: efflux RND transporter periplasmic adaptor subunit [Candidatus Margulisiibacteriota bacterium]
MSLRSVVALLVGLCLVGGIIGWTQFKKTTQVHTIALKKGSITEAVYGIGTVVSDQTFEAKVGITSALAKVFVKEGDFIQKGKPLLKLDGGAVLKAPFSGTVTKLSYKEGETVFAQNPILTLTNLKSRYLRVALEQQGMVHVRPGQPVRIQFESLPKTVFKGKVTHLFSSEGQFLVHIQVQDLPQSILPDMTADVGIEIKHHTNVLLVPISAIQNGAVLRLYKGKKETIPVTLGVVDSEQAAVQSDQLHEGDQIILPN